MAAIARSVGGVDRATLLADFVIPATTDLILAAIEANAVNASNLDEMLSKVSSRLMQTAERNVTRASAPYEPREDYLYAMPEVPLLIHQISGSVMDGDGLTVEAYFDDGLGKTVEHVPTPQPKAEPVVAQASLAPTPKATPRSTTATINALKESAISAARPKPVQETRSPSLKGPAHGRRKSDRQLPVQAKAPRKVKAPAEPKLKLPRGVRSVNETVRHDVIICLEDGRKVADLGAYLAQKFKMTPEAYRKKWDLNEAYPMKSPKLILSSGQVRQYQPVTETFVPVG
jgi:predicted transcriptional regulator